MGNFWQGVPKILAGCILSAGAACTGGGSHLSFDHAPNATGSGDLPGSLVQTVSTTSNAMGVQRVMTSPSYSVFIVPATTTAPTIQSSTHYQVSPPSIEGASDALR